IGALAVVVVMLLYANILTRKAEAKNKVMRIADVDETTIDPKVWGQNFPRQYDGYQRTSDNSRARFKWSEARPAAPEDGKAGSKLAGDPRLETIFDGYAFAIDYRERRGHAFMLHDQRETERVKQRPQPGACLNCHASNVVAYRKVGLQHGAPGTLADP